MTRSARTNAIDDYAHRVVTGRIAAGTYHRRACERHERDRTREATAAFPYRFDIERAERFFRFCAQLRHYKGEWAGRHIMLEPHQQFRLGSLFAWLHMRTGLRRFRTVYTEVPRKNGKSLEAAIVALYLTFFDGEAGAEGYCLHPSTRVLMADLSWKPIRDVRVGDEVVGVDEEAPDFRKQRKLRRAIVRGTLARQRPAVRVRFAHGAEIICSPDHKWLSQSDGANGFKWRATRELKQGYRILFLGQPWQAEESHDGGYIAGVYDGEGYLVRGERVGFQIGFSQKPGLVLDRCLATLGRLGFHPSTPRPHAGGTMEIAVRGLYECLRLLGSIKPIRLWAKADQLWENKKAPATTAEIVSITPAPAFQQELIDIETTTGTFIAEGLVSHNCIATKREQARIVFGDCKRLVQASKELRERITVLMANLHRESTASKLEPLGADRDSTDGLNPHTVTIDEAHALKTRGLIDVMETAIGARRQPVINWITTAGANPVTPCGDQHDYACKVLDQVLTDETLFAFIAHADADDDPFLETTWRKANPNYGISVKAADLEALAYKARHMPEAANAFKQKRLNIWVHTSAPWLSIEGWRRGQTAWTVDDMAGEACWLGIDMSSKIDLTAIVAVFPPTETRATWRLHATCLTPEETLDEREHRDRAPYTTWVKRGWLVTNEGKRIDQDLVRSLVLDAAARFNVQQIGIDPWNTGNLVRLLTDDGFPVIEIGQTLAQMSAPAKEFEADVLDGLVDAGGNELMTWAIANVVVQRDNKDNIYPVKRKSRGRIDPVIAALMGRKLAALDADGLNADDPELVVT